MPAETNQHTEAVTAGDVLELMWTMLTEPGTDDDGPDPSRTLADAGLDDDLAVLHLWDTVVEEYGQRSVGELDVEEAAEVATLGELADLFTRTVNDTRVDPDDA